MSEREDGKDDEPMGGESGEPTLCFQEVGNPMPPRGHGVFPCMSRGSPFSIAQLQIGHSRRLASIHTCRHARSRLIAPAISCSLSSLWTAASASPAACAFSPVSAAMVPCGTSLTCTGGLAMGCCLLGARSHSLHRAIPRRRRGEGRSGRDPASRSPLVWLPPTLSLLHLSGVGPHPLPFWDNRTGRLRPLCVHFIPSL